MPDDAGRDAAFYDHEKEPRRHVADWGGDDLFTRVPGRRAVHPLAPPRHRRPAPLDPLHRFAPEPPGRFARTDGETPSRADANQAGGHFRTEAEGSAPAHGYEAGGRFARTDGAGSVPPEEYEAGGRSARTGREGSALPDPSERGQGRTPAATPDASDLAATARARGFNVSTPPERRSGGPGGRRTVVIAGRPDGVGRPRSQRSRPPRSVADRVGPRPERIVAWAFVLGLLLILIAIATADAATL